MPFTRSTNRNQNIAPQPTGGIETTQVVSPLSPSKGHRVQPSPDTLDGSDRAHSRAPSPRQQMADNHTTTVTGPSGGKDKMAETSTPRPRGEGSNRIESSGGSSTSQRNRPIDNDHLPAPKWVRVVKVDSPPTLIPQHPDLSQRAVDDKDEAIRKLKMELEELRCAFDDVKASKTTLAEEVHRLHQSITEESEMFADMDVRDGRGDSRGYQEMLKRNGLEEIPFFLPLPAHFVSGQAVDIAAVMVIGDRIEANGLTIRFEEPIGAGGNGKIIGGMILDRETGASPPGTNSVAIKATMKSGLPSWDEELFREARALQSLGDIGLAPKLLAVVETPLRFLTIMERYPMSLWNLADYLCKESGHRGLNTEVIQFFAKRMALLLDGLHATGQVHRDIKPDNVLIKETGEMVLADFGSIALVGGTSDNSQFGTAGFTAPYVKQPDTKEKNDVYQDIWSLGATLLWMAGEDLDGEGPPSEEGCQKAVEICFPIATQPLAHGFVSKCLAFPGPRRGRLTAKKALKHPWLKEVASTEIQEKLSLSIRRAAESMQKSLWDKTEPYYLNIGVGPCRELKVLT